jgi:hypothetical protein
MTINPFSVSIVDIFELCDQYGIQMTFTLDRTSGGWKIILRKGDSKIDTVISLQDITRSRSFPFRRVLA